MAFLSLKFRSLSLHIKLVSIEETACSGSSFVQKFNLCGERTTEPELLWLEYF